MFHETPDKYRNHFAIIGDGAISNRHKLAIKSVDGVLRRICDPKFSCMEDDGVGRCCELSDGFFNGMDYVVICSPSYLHRRHTQLALEHGCKVICEKPLCLPWEPLIDNDDINVCLQLRYLDGLPKSADMVVADFWRNNDFFNSWKGDPLQAGGNLYEFFIHYIDLAIILGADFTGVVNLGDGKQTREIYWTENKIIDIKDGTDFDLLCEDNAKPFFTNGMNNEMNGPAEIYLNHTLDIMKADIQLCYNKMYADIISGGGIKPRDIFYLTWVLHHLSDQLGYGTAGIGQRIRVKKGFFEKV